MSFHAETPFENGGSGMDEKSSPEVDDNNWHGFVDFFCFFGLAFFGFLAFKI
jgi:hypothetical protein